jgi:hypothetical protein
MLRRVALARTEVSEELGASIIRVTRISGICGSMFRSSEQALVLFLAMKKNDGKSK